MCGGNETVVGGGPGSPRSHRISTQRLHRRWKAWHRWTTLAIAAHAFLAAATTVCTPSPDGLITVTVNELRRLFHALVIEPARRIADVIAWSIYRRRHQNAAKTSHYAHQSLTDP